jgi:hypothetical protein
MEFYEILEQILALLQRHGRVTYGALKRQFQLDDAYLEDLKAEIIEARQLAVDQDGRVLVWTGTVATTPGRYHYLYRQYHSRSPRKTISVITLSLLQCPGVLRTRNAASLRSCFVMS